jgi:hypothetical protein
MRRFLIIFGAISLTVAIVAVSGLAWIAYQGSKLDAESKAFVDEAVPAIVTHWDKDELLRRGSLKLRDGIRPEALRALFENFSGLGRLSAYEGAVGQSTMSYEPGSGGAVTALYEAKAKFENGRASIRLLLSKHNGQWMIENFHLEGAPGD